MDNSKIKILFLTSEPTDKSRLRIGQELRDIQERLQLSMNRSCFSLEYRMSVRPVDISQALFDIEPDIVHFSGHGIDTDQLCFEDDNGNSHPISPKALSSIFEIFADKISCVLLNACYSEQQAMAISKHVNYVIGMSQAISDKAAITFAIGFYKAILANRSLEDAFKSGCADLQIHNIPEDLTPILIKKYKNKTDCKIEAAFKLPDNLPAIRNWVGRAQEIECLKNIIFDNNTRAIEITGSALGVIGSPGIGKTFLASKIVRLLHEQKTPFLVSAWVSLRPDIATKKPPSFHSIINSLLVVLSKGEITPEKISNENFYEKTDRLIAHLKHTPCFVVIDNVESVLITGKAPKAGYFSQECKNYAYLFKSMIGIDHQSKILFTSRETIAELSNQIYKPMKLLGLNYEDSIELLKRYNLNGTDEELGKLAKFYKGHPKALELVSSLIIDIYDGMVISFLKDRKYLLTGDIDILLDEIFDRMSSKELECLCGISVYKTDVYPMGIGSISAQMPDTDEFELKEHIVRALERRQLLSYDVELSAYYLHPFIQEKAYRLLKYDEERLKIAHNRAYNYFVNIELKPKTRWNGISDVSTLICAHYHACCIGNWDNADKVIEPFRFKYLYQWGEYHLMLELMLQLIPDNWKEGCQKLSSERNHARNLCQIGVAYYNLVDYQRAKDFYNKALFFSRKLNAMARRK